MAFWISPLFEPAFGTHALLLSIIVVYISQKFSFFPSWSALFQHFKTSVRTVKLFGRLIFEIVGEKAAAIVQLAVLGVLPAPEVVALSNLLILVKLNSS